MGLELPFVPIIKWIKSPNQRLTIAHVFIYSYTWLAKKKTNLKWLPGISIYENSALKMAPYMC